MTVFPSASIKPLRVLVLILILVGLIASIFSVILDFTWVRLLPMVALGIIAFGLVSRFHREYLCDEQGLTVRHILWTRFVPYTSIAVVTGPTTHNQGQKEFRVNIYTTRGNWISLYPCSSEAMYERLRSAINIKQNG
jgi:hypothetical protein